MKFELRFPEAEISKYASLYDYPGEPELIAGPVTHARERGSLTYEEFVAIGKWKSQRPRKRQAANPPALVEEVTRIALAPSTSPQVAIEILTILGGVEWPTASVILHFCHRDPYPILDFRALWSLRTEVPSVYKYDFWNAFTDFTRQLATRAKVDMRTLDRALWKYSEIHQRAT